MMLVPSEPTECSTSSKESSVDHPLQNHLILRKIFRYCPATLKALQNQRLVCKVWKNVSEPQWRSLTVPITIIQDDNAQIQISTSKRAITLSEFIQQQNCSRVLYKNVHLKGWKVLKCHFSGAGNGDADLNWRFWNLHAPTVKILKLEACTLPSSENLFKGLFESAFLKCFPNVEKLTLLNCKLTRNDGGNVEAQGPRQRLENVQPEQMENPLIRDEDDDVQIGLALLDLNVAENPRLTHLTVQNLECLEFDDQIRWTSIPRNFPNLEAISVVSQKRNIAELYRTLNFPDVAKKLKILDAIKFHDFDSGTHPDDMTFLPSVLWFYGHRFSLEKLTLDCGANSRQDVLEMLETQTATLQELQLLRPPFFEPYASFPCDAVMPNLTKLRLWGNATTNLDFLNLLPNLKFLAWNAMCYDEINHGSLIHNYMKSEFLSPIFNGNIVENTSGLAADFKLNSMNTLEIELGSISLQCFQKLRAWMPNLKNLNVRVVGDEQFALIGKQWPKIQNLELLHGSTVSANGILDALVTKKLFTFLQSFIWRYCSCPRRTLDEECEEIAAENELRRLAGRNVVIPWRRFRSVMRLQSVESVCLQDLFEKAVANGAADVLSFFDALNNTTL